MFNIVKDVASAASEVASSLHVPGSTKTDTSFSVTEALKHVKVLTDTAPVYTAGHSPVLEYVSKEIQHIKETANEDVNVEVESFPPTSGDSKIKNVVVKILPKGVTDAEENAILVSAHIDTAVDTAFSSEGAGDDSSNVAVMLELARGLSQSASGFKNSVIFLFNTGEEDQGLSDVHYFVPQNPLIGKDVRTVIDLDKFATRANGLKYPGISFFNKGKGGGAGIFQEKHFLDLEAFSNYSKAKQITGKDLLSSGVIKSEQDFQVYKDVAGHSGLDFASTDHTAVYHTKNDKGELLKSESLQHLGDNLLAFLHSGASSHFPEAN